MPLLCICHSAPCAEALTALRDMEGKLQTCGIKQRPSETQHVVLCVREWVRACLCVCVCLKVSAKGRKTKFTLSFFFRFWECTKKTLHNIFTSNFYSLHTLYRWNSLLQLHEGVFVFPVASCQLLLDLASVTVLSGRRGNNATARPTWAHCVPE